MTRQYLPDTFLKLLEQVTGKRARIVIDHILEHGYITTEDLESVYGYKHPPRAVADVRDQGIPIETFKTKSSTGQAIAGYRFGNPEDAIVGQTGGRRNFPQNLKTTLYKHQDGKCALCTESYSNQFLQVDHRVPYRVAGEVDDMSDKSRFMLVCRSCNRAKSWTCEQCPNIDIKDNDMCLSCYWVNPENYIHIATRSERRLDIVWSDAEITDYDKLVTESDEDIRSYIKRLLKQHINDSRHSKK